MPSRAPESSTTSSPRVSLGVVGVEGSWGARRRREGGGRRRGGGRREEEEGRRREEEEGGGRREDEGRTEGMVERTHINP